MSIVVQLFCIALFLPATLICVNLKMCMALTVG